MTNKQLHTTYLPLALGLAFMACSSEKSVAPEAEYRVVMVSGNNQIGPSLAPLATPLRVRVEDADGNGVKGVRVNFRIDPATSLTASLRDTITVTDMDGLADAWLTLGVDSTLNGAVDESSVVVRASIAVAPWREVRFSATRQGRSRLELVMPSVAKAGEMIAFQGSNLGGLVVRAHFGDVSVQIASGVTTPSAATGATGGVIVPPCVKPGVVDFWLVSDGRRSNSIPVTINPSRPLLSLAPGEYVTLPASRVAECVSLAGDGANYLIAAQFASVGSAEPTEWQIGAPAGAASVLAAAREPATAHRRAPMTAHAEFEATLRRTEESIASQARSQRLTTALRAVPPAPLLGSQRSFRVVSNTEGTAFTTVTAELRFAGAHVLVYTDTADAGFSGEQLMALAALYDRDLYGAAVKAFGAEPDLDGNGRVIALFTPVINRMSRREDCFQRGFVTGFFYAVDELERDPESNRGEIFYSYIPDPAAKYSCAHVESDVIRTLQPTFLHEMQHLISYNERVLARGGEAEEKWLNEGLSQMAEELGSKLFEARYPAPLGRSTTTQLFPDSAAPFIAPQMLNAYVYMFFSLDNSLTSYEGNGSFEERGGTWLFLRWLADQKGEGVLKQLVQGSRRGAANIESIAGEALPAFFADFSLALAVDSLPGYPRSTVPPRLRFSSRNIRQLMAREAVISGFMQPYPLPIYVMNSGSALRGAMPSGTMMHARLQSNPGNGPLRLSFTLPGGAPLPSALGAQISIMRLPQ